MGPNSSNQKCHRKGGNFNYSCLLTALSPKNRKELPTVLKKRKKLWGFSFQQVNSSEDKSIF